MKEIFKNACIETTGHGFARLIKAKFYITKVIWFCAILAANIICVGLIISTIIKYLHFDVVTKIIVIDEVQIPFPQITICNTHPFITNKAMQLLEKEFKFLYPNLSSDYINPLNYDQEIFASYKTYLSLLGRVNNNFNETEKKSLGYGPEEFFIQSSFESNSLSDLDDYEWYWDISYGNCYIFNSGRNGKKVRNYRHQSLTYEYNFEIFIGNQGGKSKNSDFGLFTGKLNRQFNSNRDHI
jgi:hypothetical protein